MYKEDMVKLFFDNNKIVSKRCTESYLLKHNIDLRKYGNFDTTFLSISEIVFAIYLGYNETPKCENCGSFVGRDPDNRDRFKKYCSFKCFHTKHDYKKAALKRDIDVSNKKRSITMKNKYGVEFNSQRDDVKKIISDKMTKKYLSDEVLQKLKSIDWLTNEYETKARSAVDIAKELNIYYGTVIEYLKKYNFTIRPNSNYSLEEKEIVEFLKSLNLIIVENDRSLIDFELDIYIPSKKIAIEYNGLYWHSSPIVNTKIINKHLIKTIKCEQLGIQLIQIFSDEWKYKKDIIKSMLLSKLGLITNKIYARSCEFKLVDIINSKKFLNENHIQGYVYGDNYGLYHNNELVFLLTLGISRFEKNKIELLRLCTKKYTLVVGGISKILNKIDFNEIITYADRRYSTIHSYGNMFKYIGYTKPNYYWVDKHNEVRISRYKTMKHKLYKLLKNYDENKTENENMFFNNYRILFDSGNLKFLITK